MAFPEQISDASRWQQLLEQTFSPDVAALLACNPELLAGQTCEVTVLFADLCGFTPIAESLAPAMAYDLLGEVMELFADIVQRHDGIVIDFYGDGLSAMWNAPLEQPRHADLACGAACQIVDDLFHVNTRWEARLDAPLRCGVGVHTGIAQVGNAGTRRRFKYGPRGSAVNVASRVQSATRYLRTPLAVTRPVVEQLSGAFRSLRVCTSKLPGIDQPMELCTVLRASHAERVQEDLCRYSAALLAFERDELDDASELVESLLARDHAVPAEFLAQQVAAQRLGNLGRRAADESTRHDHAVIEILAK